MAVILLVTGPPCAGKSTLATLLRQSLRWPLFAKDAFKETLFEALGWSDRAWSKRVSQTSYELMFAAAAELAANGNHCILEGNFRWSENERRLVQLRATPQLRFVQVFCTAPADVLVARFRERTTAQPRHPGHVDQDSFAQIEAELRERPAEPLPLGEPTLTVDSTHATTEFFTSVVERVRASLGNL